MSPLRLTSTTRDDFRRMGLPTPGDDGCLPGAALADTLRAQSLLLGTTLRRVLLDRTVRFLAPLTDEPDLRSRVESVLKALVSLGDLSRDGAVVAPAPLRAVPLDGDRAGARWLLVGGPPTERLGMPVDTPGLRVVRPEGGSDEALIRDRVEALGGRMSNLDAWSGRRAPVLSLEWLERERDRLAAAAQSVGLGPGSNPRVYVAATMRPLAAARWRFVTPKTSGWQLVDLSRRGTAGPFAWGRFDAGTLVTMTELSSDHALELGFALDREAQNPRSVRFERQPGGDVVIRGLFLPRSEWRIVHALSFLRPAPSGGLSLDPRDAEWILVMLVDRLGVHVVRSDAAPEGEPDVTSPCP